MAQKHWTEDEMAEVLKRRRMGWTLRQLAAFYGKTPERIRQLEYKAIRLEKRRMYGEGPAAYQWTVSA